MRKILVCITSPIHVRNFIDSGVIPYLSNENQLDLVITRNISLTAAQEKCFSEIHFVQAGDSSSSLENVFKVYSIRYKKLSKSFGYRNWRQNPPLYFLILGKIYRAIRRIKEKRSSTKTSSRIIYGLNLKNTKELEKGIRHRAKKAQKKALAYALEFLCKQSNFSFLQISLSVEVQTISRDERFTFQE